MFAAKDSLNNFNGFSAWFDPKSMVALAKARGVPSALLSRVRTLPPQQLLLGRGGLACTQHAPAGGRARHPGVQHNGDQRHAAVPAVPAAPAAQGALVKLLMLQQLIMLDGASGGNGQLAQFAATMADKLEASPPRCSVPGVLPLCCAALAGATVQGCGQ